MDLAIFSNSFAVGYIDLNKIVSINSLENKGQVRASLNNLIYNYSKINLRR